MNEHTCARSLTAKLRKAGLYVLKLNVNFAAGIPDMWVSGQTGDMWIELKFVPELPKRDSTLVVPNLSALQRQWLCDRARQAVRVCVILFTKAGAVVFDRPDWWTTGMSAGEARSRLISLNELADWICDRLGREEPASERNNEATSPAHAHPALETADPDRRAHEGAVAAPQGQDGRDTGAAGRGAGDHAGGLHAVPERPHRRQHRLRAAVLPSAGRGPRRSRSGALQHPAR